jgi:hypothetical protein
MLLNHLLLNHLLLNHLLPFNPLRVYTSKAHLVAFAFLVILAHEAAEGGAALVLAEASVVVVVEDEFAGEGGGPFSRAHAADGEGVHDILVAEGHEVSRVGAEEGDHHVASDALLEAVRSPENAGEAPGEARVGEVALEWGWEPSVAGLLQENA